MDGPPVLISFAFFEVYRLCTDSAAWQPSAFVGDCWPPGRRLSYVNVPSVSWLSNIAHGSGVFLLKRKNLTGDWRNIPITLTESEKGEAKAQTCEKARRPDFDNWIGYRLATLFQGKYGSTDRLSTNFRNPSLTAGCTKS